MSFLENLKSYTFNEEELWDFCIENLNEFKELNRLDELIDLISSLRDNSAFLKIPSLEK